MKIERRIYIGMLVAKALAENGETLQSACGIAATLGLPETPVRQVLVRLRQAEILKAEKGPSRRVSLGEISRENLAPFSSPGPGRE